MAQAPRPSLHPGRRRRLAGLMVGTLLLSGLVAASTFAPWTARAKDDGTRSSQARQAAAGHRAGAPTSARVGKAHHPKPEKADREAVAPCSGPSSTASNAQHRRDHTPQCSDLPSPSTEGTGDQDVVHSDRDTDIVSDGDGDGDGDADPTEIEDGAQPTAPPVSVPVVDRSATPRPAPLHPLVVALASGLSAAPVARLPVPPARIPTPPPSVPVPGSTSRPSGAAPGATPLPAGVRGGVAAALSPGGPASAGPAAPPGGPASAGPAAPPGGPASAGPAAPPVSPRSATLPPLLPAPPPVALPPASIHPAAGGGGAGGGTLVTLWVAFVSVGLVGAAFGVRLVLRGR